MTKYIIWQIALGGYVFSGLPRRGRKIIFILNYWPIIWQIALVGYAFSGLPRRGRKIIFILNYWL